MSQFAYFPHTEEDVRAMLERIGVKDTDALYADVPEQFFRKHTCALGEALSEQEVREWFERLGAMNPKLTVLSVAARCSSAVVNRSWQFL